MGRKIKFDKNCGSKFITIDDEKKWELIREIATVKRYESSFNAIVNDALAFGLPELHKRLFDKVQLDGEEKAVSVPKEYSGFNGGLWASRPTLTFYLFTITSYLKSPPPYSEQRYFRH